VHAPYLRLARELRREKRPRAIRQRREASPASLLVRPLELASTRPATAGGVMKRLPLLYQMCHHMTVMKHLYRTGHPGGDLLMRHQPSPASAARQNHCDVRAANVLLLRNAGSVEADLGRRQRDRIEQ